MCSVRAQYHRRARCRRCARATQVTEQDNDAAIAHMAERAGMLRAVTVEMQGEVDSQNRMLDSMVR